MPIRRRGELGKIFSNGQIIVQQGDIGEEMYVVQSGKVEVVLGSGDNEERVAVLGPKDFFGEMALFDKEVRSATIRALGETRVLTIDKRTLLRRISEDPLLAFRMLKSMSSRVRELNQQVSAARNRSTR